MVFGYFLHSPAACNIHSQYLFNFPMFFTFDRLRHRPGLHPWPGPARPWPCLWGAFLHFITFPLFFTFGLLGRSPSPRPWPRPASPVLSVGGFPYFFPLSQYFFFTSDRLGRRPSLRPWPGPGSPALSVGAYQIFSTFGPPQSEEN